MSNMHSSHWSHIPASIEISPTQALNLTHLPSLFPRGVRVYLPDLSGESDETLLKGSRRLTDLGYVAVPHLAARRCASRTSLEQRVKALTQEAGVHDVLVIGGELKTPAGEFSSSMDLLETGILDKFGVTDIGVAGHPEGNPNVPTAITVEAVRQKSEFSARSDARIRLVTQFGFDGHKAVSWARALEAEGIGLPVHIGVAGPAKITTLIKYAAICGVGNSLEFLRKRGRSLAALTTNHSPESVVEPVEAYALEGAGSNVKQIHVFSFGGVKNTAQWLSDRGSWEQSNPAAGLTGAIR